MSQGSEFYAARAVEAKAEANEATLENVRERALRSEAMWLQLAHHAKMVEVDREKARLEREAKSQGWPL